MNYLRRETIRALIGFGVVLVLVGATMFFVRGEIIATVMLVEQYFGQLSVREANAKALSVLHEQYESQVMEYEEILKSYIPRRDDLVNVSREIESVATRSGVNAVVALLSEAPPDLPTFGFVAYSVTVNGNLQSVADFFENMRNFRFLNSREGFTFREQVSGVEASTRLKVYYQTY